ncbi:MAG: hypothetical protein M3Y91_05645 [Actinomycetota bacterium]|nr:hypothetical protein [Actinomycetota bacterium]
MTLRPVGAVFGAVAVVVAAVVMVACGPPGPPLTGPGRLPLTGQTSSPAAAPTSATPGPVTTPPTTTAPVAPLGTPVAVPGPGGAQASVDATAIVDPASPAHSYDAPGPGQRFVAVKVEITDTGATPLQENALDDMSIVSSTGAAQTPVVTEVAGCASFVGGAFALGPDTAAVDSCVTFELPTTATVKVVHFALGRDTAGQGAWAVP